MSLLFFEGFDSVSTNTELTSLNPFSANAGSFSNTDGRYNGGKWTLSPVGGSYLLYNVPASTGEFFQGTAVRCDTLYSTSNYFLTFNSDAGAEWTVGTDSTRSIYVWRGTAGSANLVISNSAVLPFSGVYFWLESRYKWGNNNNGSFDLWVNGVQVVSLSNVNTVNRTAQTSITKTGFHIGSTTQGAYLSIDDWYVVKVDSTSPNTRIGDARVSRIDPNSDYITSGTSTPGPAYYTSVDDGATANTSDYITFNNTTGENVAFGTTSLASNAGNIIGISVITQQLKSDAGSANARHIVISNGTQSNGSMFTLSTTSTKNKTYFVTDPYTSAAWTNTAVANVKIGFGVST